MLSMRLSGVLTCTDITAFGSITSLIFRLWRGLMFSPENQFENWKMLLVEYRPCFRPRQRQITYTSILYPLLFSGCYFNTTLMGFWRGNTIVNNLSFFNSTTEVKIIRSLWRTTGIRQLNDIQHHAFRVNKYDSTWEVIRIEKKCNFYYIF